VELEGVLDGVDAVAHVEQTPDVISIQDDSGVHMRLSQVYL
jgi:hypothetical protein